MYTALISTKLMLPNLIEAKERGDFDHLHLHLPLLRLRSSDRPSPSSATSKQQRSPSLTFVFDFDQRFDPRLRLGLGPRYRLRFDPRPSTSQAASKQTINQGSRGMAEGSGRKKPNILVTGTPGTGKTTTSSLLAESTQLRHINIGDLVRDNNLHDGWDDHFDCHIINEDLVCDKLEDMMEEGGNIVDYHGCDFFPERWFDRVVVLQTENSVLYDRLTKRGYTGSKLTNNIECEIFQVLLEEAKDSYPEDIVVPLKSDNVDDINRNIATLTDWVGSWCPKP